MESYLLGGINKNNKKNDHEKSVRRERYVLDIYTGAKHYWIQQQLWTNLVALWQFNPYLQMILSMTSATFHSQPQTLFSVCSTYSTLNTLLYSTFPFFFDTTARLWSLSWVSKNCSENYVSQSLWERGVETFSQMNETKTLKHKLQRGFTAVTFDKLCRF